jgi:hypothetical protein
MQSPARRRCRDGSDRQLGRLPAADYGSVGRRERAAGLRLEESRCHGCCFAFAWGSHPSRGRECRGRSPAAAIGGISGASAPRAERGIMALARGLEITKLASRMSCCVRAESCGLDRGHFGCRRKVGVGLGWPESRGSPIAFALIERRGTAVVGEVLLYAGTTTASLQRRSYGRWARTWKTEVKPRSKPRRAART